MFLPLQLTHQNGNEWFPGSDAMLIIWLIFRNVTQCRLVVTMFLGNLSVSIFLMLHSWRLDLHAVPKCWNLTTNQCRRKFKKREYLKLTPFLSKSLSGPKILKVILKRKLQDLPLPPKKLKVALLATKRRISIIQSEVKDFRPIRRYWIVQELIKVYH